MSKFILHTASLHSPSLFLGCQDSLLRFPRFLRSLSFGLSLVTLVTLLTTTLTGCSSDKEYTGYVEGEYVQIALPFSGQLEHLFVQRGQWVKRNTPLFQLDLEPEFAKMKEAQQRYNASVYQVEDLKKGKRPEELEVLMADREQIVVLLELYEKNYLRDKKLLETDSTSQQLFDEAQTNYEKSKAQLIEIDAQIRLANLGSRIDQIRVAESTAGSSAAALVEAEWNLQEKRQLSPVEGYVQDTLYNVGDFVQANAPVITLLPPENVYVRFFIPETALSTVSVGQKVEVTCDSCKSGLFGRVRYISSQAEFTPPVIFSRASRDKLVFLVEVTLDKKSTKDTKDRISLKPGQPVDIRLKN